jgi:hypothetical protein
VPSQLNDNIVLISDGTSDGAGTSAPQGNVGIQNPGGQTGFFIVSDQPYDLWLLSQVGAWSLHQSHAQAPPSGVGYAWGDNSAFYIASSSVSQVLYLYPRDGAILIDGDVNDGVDELDTIALPSGSSTLATVGTEQFPGWSSSNNHILPDATEAYDIGSADYKVRHLFLSDNSLWIGSNNKISISGGKVKSRKRKVDDVPKFILDSGATAADFTSFYPARTAASITTTEWVAFAKDFTGAGSLSPAQVITDADFEDDDDWDDYIIIDDGVAGNLTLRGSTGQEITLVDLISMFDNVSNVLVPKALETSANTTAIAAIDTSGIAANATAIAAIDTSGIAANATAIATIDTSGIAANATAIATIDTSGIAANAAAIAANVTNISWNGVIGIGGNKAAIEAIDTSGIATNAAAIAAIDTSGIATNAAAIAAIDTSGIATNAAAISNINTTKHTFTDHIVLKDKRDLHFYDETNSIKGQVAYNESSSGNFMKVSLEADGAKSRTISLNAGNTDGSTPEGAVKLIGETIINRDGVIYNVTDSLDSHSASILANATSIASIDTSASVTNTADIATNTADIATNTADIATNTAAIHPTYIESRGLKAAGGNGYPQAMIECRQDPTDPKEDHVFISSGGAGPEGHASIYVGHRGINNIYDGEIGQITFRWQRPGEQENSLSTDTISNKFSELDAIISKPTSAMDIMQVDADLLRLPSLVATPVAGTMIQQPSGSGNLRILNDQLFNGSMNDYSLVIANTNADPRNEGEGADSSVRVLKLAMAEDPRDNIAVSGDITPGWFWGKNDDDSYPAYTASNDRFLICSSKAGSEGNGGSLRYYIDGLGVPSTSLTAQHWVVYKALAELDRLENIKPGMILSSTGKMFNKERVEQALPIVSLASTSNDKRVYGVLSSDISSGFDLDKWDTFEGSFNSKTKRLEEDDDNPDPCVYSDDSMHYKARSNSGGEGMIWVTNLNGDLENGDYVTTCSIPGYGMLQDDDLLHNYTVAKIAEDVDWADVTEVVDHGGISYKACLISCTYHCG